MVALNFAELGNLIITSLLLGVGLAMDAFSVSLADGLAETKMNVGRVSALAGTFALFQFSMPMIGWWLVHTAVNRLMWLMHIVPWIAMLLLCAIGLKMLFDGVREAKHGKSEMEGEVLGTGTLMAQGVATSIDALSVGFANASYEMSEALLSAVIIGLVTFAICTAGLLIGKKVGDRISWIAPVAGGILLIIIGFRIAVC